MMMYNILLVDDEENVRCSIKDLTPWKDHGFNEPAVASNGREALDMLEDSLPDVIITDIKMPYMSGIEFIEEVRKRYTSSIEIIVLSGFDEFTFAQEAVRLKVAEYVLKPVSVESMCSLLDRIRTRIEKEKAKYFDSEKLSEVYKEAFSLYREKYLKSLILPSKKIDEDQLYRAADIFGFPMRSYTLFAIAVIENMSTIKTQLALSELSKETFEEEEVQPVLFQNNDQSVFLFRSALPSDQEHAFRKHVYKMMSLLSENAEHYLSTMLNIGIGSSVSSLSALRSSYKEAVEALDYSLYHPEESIIRYSDIASSEKNSGEKDYTEERTGLILAVKFAGKPEVDSAIDRFFASTSSFEDIQMTVLYIITIIAEICLAYSRLFAELMDPNEDLFIRISNIRSISAAVSFCKDIAEKANLMTSGARENSHIKFVESAKRIILRSYSDPLFGLEQLCDEISISPAYFSTTFKKETGTSFVQFLTNTRIEKAKELLRNSDLKTYEIAEKVGFSEPNYFSFTFRRNTGISPSQYKSQYKV